MRTQFKVVAVTAALMTAGCGDLALTNPNQRTAATFWRDQSDALTALNAVYNMLYQNGNYGANREFVSDARADIGTSRSPATELLNFTRTVLTNYNFGRNADLWSHPQQGVFRANLVLAEVPKIQMDEGLKSRIQAEAKFLRALFRYNVLETHGQVPLIDQPVEAGFLPTSAAPAAVYAAIEKDLTEAAAVLPERYTGENVGRATKGAALTLLGTTQMMQKKWAQGAATLGQVVASGVYQLVPSYAENFRPEGENNAESVFEIQFGDPATAPSGARGADNPRLVGPPGVAFTDAQPTEWFFQQFFVETGQADPRLEHTIFYNKPGGMDVFGRPFASRYPTGFRETNINKTYFWKKYQQYYKAAEDFNSPLNFKVFRYATVLLLHAEALNEAGQTAAALAPLNQVRARVGLPALPAGLGQSAMRARIEHEMLLELGWEQQRVAYLKRHDMFKRAVLEPHDPDFFFFVDGKSELLPIPQTEVDLNPNIKQNPGW